VKEEVRRQGTVGSERTQRRDVQEFVPTEREAKGQREWIHRREKVTHSLFLTAEGGWELLIGSRERREKGKGDVGREAGKVSLVPSLFEDLPETGGGRGRARKRAEHSGGTAYARSWLKGGGGRCWAEGELARTQRRKRSPRLSSDLPGNQTEK